MRGASVRDTDRRVQDGPRVALSLVGQHQKRRPGRPGARRCGRPRERRPRGRLPRAGADAGGGRLNQGALRAVVLVRVRLFRREHGHGARAQPDVRAVRGRLRGRPEPRHPIRPALLRAHARAVFADRRQGRARGGAPGPDRTPQGLRPRHEGDALVDQRLHHGPGARLPRGRRVRRRHVLPVLRRRRFLLAHPARRVQPDLPAAGPGLPPEVPHEPRALAGDDGGRVRTPRWPCC